MYNKQKDRNKPVPLIPTANPLWTEISDNMIAEGGLAQIRRKDGTLAQCLVESIGFDDNGKLSAIVTDAKGEYQNKVRLSACRLLSQNFQDDTETILF